MHHPLNVAYILTDLYADSDTLSAALLHDTIHIGNADLQDIENTFGKDISMLVKGITKIVYPETAKYIDDTYIFEDVEEIKKLGFLSVPMLSVDGKILNFKEAFNFLKNEVN